MLGALELCSQIKNSGTNDSSTEKKAPNCKKTKTKGEASEGGAVLEWKWGIKKDPFAWKNETKSIWKQYYLLPSFDFNPILRNYWEDTSRILLQFVQKKKWKQNWDQTKRYLIDELQSELFKNKLLIMIDKSAK